jgi:hypothetical protein
MSVRLEAGACTFLEHLIPFFRYHIREQGLDLNVQRG